MANRLTRKAIILLLSIGSISCTKERTFEKRYENGNVKEVWYYEQDTLNGRKEKFWANGNLFEVLRFENGQLNGEYLGYYENGFIARKGTFLNGNLRGPYFEYSPEEDGLTLLEVYFIPVKGKEYAYYKRSFDRTGSLTKEERVVLASVRSDDTSNDSVRLEYLEDVEFDSINIILGKFSENFMANASTLDTIRTKESSLSIPLSDKHVSNGYIRGIFHIYKANPEGDSTRIDIKIRYFEEKTPGE